MKRQCMTGVMVRDKNRRILRKNIKQFYGRSVKANSINSAVEIDSFITIHG